jgi:hypothetical protein
VSRKCPNQWRFFEVSGSPIPFTLFYHNRASLPYEEFRRTADRSPTVSHATQRLLIAACWETSLREWQRVESSARVLSVFGAVPSYPWVLGHY